MSSLIDRRNEEIGNIREEVGKLKGITESNAAAIYQIQQDHKHHRAEVHSEMKEFQNKIETTVSKFCDDIRNEFKLIRKNSSWLMRLAYVCMGGGGATVFIMLNIDKIKAFWGH